MQPGEMLQLYPAVTGAGFRLTDVNYASTDDTVMTVGGGGLLRALAAGSARIDVTALVSPTGATVRAAVQATVGSVRPVISLLTVPASKTTSRVASIGYLITPASTSGKVQCRLDGAAARPCPNPLLLGATAPLAIGSHQVDYYVDFGAGLDEAKPDTSYAWAIQSTCTTSGDSWAALNFPAQTDAFVAEFDATPSVTPMSTVVGLASTPVTIYEGLAAIVRFADTGVIDVRNPDIYAADVAVPYAVGKKYHFRMVVNPKAHVFSVFVTAPGGTELRLANQYGFRGEQATASSLSSRIVHAEPAGGGLLVCDFVVHP
jgi:hypothetical protein